MGQFRSLGCALFLVTLLTSFQPFVLGYSIPRSTNATSVANITTSANDTGSTSVLTRENYDATVVEWKKQNPHLADILATESIETLWAHVSGNAVTEKRKRSPPPRNAPLYKRQNATQSDLDAARKLVALAVAEAEEQNLSIKKNPTRNSYTARPVNGTNTEMRRDGISSSIINATIASAAAVVAEADAQQLAANGTLFKDYTLTGKYAKYNQPGFPTGSKLKKRDTYYWLEDMASQYPGTFPYGDDDTYVVYRNVMDAPYNAKGDGVTDDTAAINAAIADGNRCGSDCGSSSVKGALVYFPSGTYLVSSPIIALYNTQLVGNLNDYPTILAAPAFVGLGVITSDVYLGGTDEYYINTNNFLRQVRNFVIDMTECTTAGIAGVHWQVAQATSLQNLFILMTDASTSTQIGVFSENGSGGWMSDLIFYGGSIGLQCGNQQFTTRNLAFLSVDYAIYMLWDWGWTWKSLDVFDCNWGIWFETTDVGGSIYVVDSIFTNTIAAIVIDSPAGSTINEQVLISIDNMVLSATDYAVIVENPTVIILDGGSLTIPSWVLGPVYDTENPDGTWFGGAALDDPHPVTGMLAGGPQAGYFERSKPGYASTTSAYWLSATLLATGDGTTDDTANLSFMFYLGSTLGFGIFIPTGSYIVASPPLAIPINSVISGACWSQLVAYGDSYNNMDSPVAMITVGSEGDLGNIEIQDVMFTVKGPTQGAILVEWNAYQGEQGTVGMWDCHFRIGGALGTDLQAANCPIGSNNEACIAASLGLHITSGASGYFENMWVWTADHDMDSGVAQTQVNVFSGRGILIESQGPVWLYGTASEHSVLYQYNLAGAANIYMGMIQTESPYYPPFLIAPAPFTSSLQVFNLDPTFSDCNGVFPCAAAWALTITESDNIQMTGAGLYSWFDNYDEACVDTQNCQQRLAATQNNGHVYLLNVYTIGSIGMVHDFIETIGTEVSSTLALALAAANTVENAHPFLSAIVAWVEVFAGWGSGDSTGTSSTSGAGICSVPDYTTDVSGESADKKIASTLNYFLETTEGGTLSRWAHNLWAINNATQNCGVVNGACGPSTSCTSMTNPSDWWIENTIGNWNSYMSLFYNSWLPASFNISSRVGDIVAALPIQLPQNLANSAAWLNNFGAVLSILGGGMGGLEDPAGGIFISALGGIMSDTGANLPTAADEAITSAALINDRIADVLTAITSTITANMLALITNGDVTNWPSGAFKGTYETSDPIAAYFDNGNLFYSPSDADFDATTLTKNLSIILEQSVAGFALNAANWYIIRNAYTAAECTSITTGMIMANDGGLCYTLEAPGNGLPATYSTSEHTTFSVPMDQTTLTSLNGFGVDLQTLYESSWNCQSGSGQYDTLGYFSYNALTFTTDVPTCFYNLPVISVNPATETDSVWLNTPCQIVVNNNTATTQSVGTSYLPDNLWSVFDGAGFCCVWEDHGVAFCAVNVSED